MAVIDKSNDPLEAALRHEAEAEVKHSVENHLEARAHKQRAERLLALDYSPEVGAGRELTLSEAEADESPGLAETITHPNLTTARASRDRLVLAAEAGALSLAADAAETIGASNSLEKMLAHQLSTQHSLAMKLAAKADRLLEKMDHVQQIERKALYSVEASRCANASGRLIKGFQEGLGALQKLRLGQTQRIIVQHVHVSDGGQAVVAGAVEGGRRGSKKK